MDRNKNAMERIAFIQDTILNENISRLAAAVEPFSANGVIIAEDLQDVWIKDIDSVTTVETPHAQELSWLFYKLRDNLSDVMLNYHKEEFYGRLAEAANLYLLKGDEMLGLLMAVLFEASRMAYETLHTKMTLIRDEVLSCVGSLSDIAEQI